jgi:prepilin-type N-terminal cleavage/methylation domain-containing protein
MKSKLKNIKGFTLVELLVSVGIFALMTALLMTRYGNFNQGILLNNLAYDIALNIRSAQSYGLNVKSAPGAAANFSNDFRYPFGVEFESNSDVFILFADINSNGFFDDGLGAILTTRKIKNIASIDSLCVTNTGSCSTTVSTLTISFRRPDPNAIIRGDAGTTNMNMAEITVKSTDGSKKKIVVRSNGQIGVENVTIQAAQQAQQQN